LLAPSPPKASYRRPIALLALAGFASQSMVRSADTLLPQIATDLGVTVGAASIVVSAYTLAHGTMQIFLGPFADRFNKYLMSAVTCALCALTVSSCGLAQGLGSLTLACIASGLTASWVIPLGFAFIGDVVPYEQRQTVLGRFLAGQVSGQLFGQAAGGMLGDLVGWRGAFFVLGGIFALASLALFREYATNPLTRARTSTREASVRGISGYRIVLTDPWSRFVILVSFLEAAFMFGAFAFIGADLHGRFGLGFTAVGAVVGTFGIGGLIYAATVKQLFPRLGQRGLAALGGCVLGGAYLVMAGAPVWWIAPFAVTVVGLGYYMLHNTLQTTATQMSPQARGTAIGLFSCAIYFGQTAGVAVSALMVDRVGTPPLFVAAAVLLPALAFWYASRARG
jgi:MFS transporter, YNFM family, putative membrane transport protein